MDDLFIYFADLSNLHKLAWLIGCLAFTSLVENIIPLRSLYRGDSAAESLSAKGSSRWLHFRTNGSLLFCTMLINAAFTILVLTVCAFTAEHHFGLLAWLTLPLWLEFIIALMVMDLFAQYTIHYLLHKVPILWRFHQIHHSDTEVDATTGTRHHPIDYLSREIFTIIVVLLLGIPPEFYVLYRLITVFCTYFTHANIQLPNWLDKSLSWVVVTPNAHKFHHHQQQPWTDSNYGNIFVFWDRLFRTFVYQSTENIIYGVDTMDPNKANSLAHQLLAPFKAQRSRSETLIKPDTPSI